MTRRGSPGAATAGAGFSGIDSSIPTICPGDGGGGGTSGRGITDPATADAGGDGGTTCAAAAGSRSGTTVATKADATAGADTGISSVAMERNSSGASGSAGAADTPAASTSTGAVDTGVTTVPRCDGNADAPPNAGSVGATLAADENDGSGRNGAGRFATTGSPRAGVDGPLAAGLCTGVSGCGTAEFVSGVVEPTVIRTIAPQTLHRARTPFGGTFEGSTRNTERQS